ncbi:MAG: imidazole glycerol phosphate synthase subunit HisH [Phycisphaerales bacterium]
MTDVHVLDTGVANVASVAAGLERAGARVVHTREASDVAGCARLVVPGVGAFGAGMASLHDAGVVDALRERVSEGRATLAICLGMQLLFEGSAESPGVAGVGAIGGTLTGFPDDGRSTHFGWNTVKAPEGARLLTDGYAYFAHSFRLERAPDGWRCAVTRLNGAYVSALEREGVLACQFHPELSGRWGRELLGRWVMQQTEVTA